MEGNFFEDTKKNYNGQGKVYSFEKVERFSYLWTKFGRKPDTKREIERSLMMGNRCLCALNGVISSEITSRGVKLRICMTIIKHSNIW